MKSFIILILIASFSMLYLNINNAYAVCGASTGSDCFTFDSSDGYVIGHGMRVNVTDPSPGSQPSITITEFGSNGNTVSSTTLGTTNLNIDRVKGVVYLNTYLMLTTSPSCTNCDPPSLNAAIGNSFQVTYTFTNGTSVTSRSQSIVTDNPGTVWPYPPPGPQPDTTTIISCSASTGRAGSSGDYICDDWKKSSGIDIPYTDKYGNHVDYTFACTDDQSVASANPALDYPCPKTYHKDVYVEVDWMQNHGPSKSAIQSVVDAYKNAGIFLHVQYSDEIPHKTIITGPNNGGDSTDYTNIKKIYFGTASDRTCPSGFTGDCNTYVSNILTAKRQIFHYVLFGHQQSSNTFSSGRSKVVSSSPWGAANDMLISLGSFSYGVGSPDQQAGTFMHELGHNLGLDHGGPYKIATDSAVNCKPNYLSLMSWTRQFSDLFGSSGRPLDYSVGKAELAWLKFEGDLSDSSGTGHGGTATGSATNYVTGEILNALNFASTTVTLTNTDNALNFDVNTPFTVSFWAKTTDTSAANEAFVTQVQGIHGKGWYVWMYGGNHHLIFDINDGTNISEVASTGAINDGLWHHYAVTYSGTGSGSIMQIYVDGVLNNWKTSTTSGSIQNPTLGVTIGNTGSGMNQLNAKMDEVHIFNTVLSQSKIQSLFNEKLQDFQKAWLKFEGDLSDSSGTGHGGSTLSATNYVTGGILNALNFASTTVTLTNTDNALNFDVNTPFTVSFWANTTDTSAANEAFVTQVQGIHGKGWYVWMYGGNHHLIFDINDGTNISEVASTGAINDGLWHHYAVTYSGTGSGSIMQIYVDGVLNNWKTSTTSGSIQNPTLGVTIGNTGSGMNQLNAKMDELHIFNTTLSASQVNLLFREVTPGYDYMLNTSPITENPVTSIPNQYTIFGISNGISQPTRADTVANWDLDGQVAPDNPETSLNLIPSTPFTTPAKGMNPGQVSITCPTTTATSFTTWDDWHNLMFDMTTTSSFASGAGDTVVSQPYIIYIVMLLYVIVVILAIIVWRKWRKHRRKLVAK